MGVWGSGGRSEGSVALEALTSPHVEQGKGLWEAVSK